MDSSYSKQLKNMNGLVINHANHILESSEAFCELTEYSSGELEGMEIDYVFRELLRSEPEPEKLFCKSKFTIFTKTLKFRKIIAQPLIDLKKGWTILTIHEIPDSRFEDKNLYLQTLILEDVIGLGVFSAPDFRLINANQTYLNYLPEPFNSRKFSFGKHVGEFTNSYSRLKAWKSVVESRRSLYLWEESGILKNDDGRIWTNVLTPIIEGSEVTYIVSILHDITEQVVARERLNQNEERMEAGYKEIYQRNLDLEKAINVKDEFLYLITHEFKTPLTVISSALQTMDIICGKSMPEKAAKYIKTIRQNTYRQMRLVNNLLDVTRISNGQIKLNNALFDIVYLVRMIVYSIQLIAVQKGIDITFSTSIRKKEIYIDEEKVERILLNLLSNALKFTPREKEIHVALSTKRIKSKNMVCISVKDQGIGIPKEKHEEIFRRFGQANTNLSMGLEGSGIGLYLVQLYVSAMGGTIALKSEEGKGSVFTVLLPANRVKAPNNDQGQTEEFANMKANLRDSRLTQEIAIQFSDIYI